MFSLDEQICLRASIQTGKTLNKHISKESMKEDVYMWV